MAQCLREHWLLLQKTWASVLEPTWQLTNNRSTCSRESDTLSGLPGHQACTWCTDIYAGKAFTYIKQK